MEKILEESLLFDFYGELLTKKQRQVYAEVRFGDLSLSEAAELYGISRQGVHDLLRRVDEILSGYEENLHLVSQFLAVRKQTDRLKALAEGNPGFAGELLDIAAQLEAVY